MSAAIIGICCFACQSTRDSEPSGRSAAAVLRPEPERPTTKPCEPFGPSDPAEPVRFAVVGDYGAAGPAEARVAALVKGWKPDFILTAGDNNYPSGSAETIDANIGQYFRQFICPYKGRYGAGSSSNRFFPVLGNHDWYTEGATPYLDYFELPGNERYYDVSWGPVQIFALDSDPHEPDGVTAQSAQGQWLKKALGASKARWKIVAMHHAPYSSGPHSSTVYMQWPYKQWGADLIVAGHDHTYERFEIDGLPYVVSGLGGASIYPVSQAAPGSQILYNSDYGAGLVEATASELSFRFFGANGAGLDELRLPRVAPAVPASSAKGAIRQSGSARAELHARP